MSAELLANSFTGLLGTAMLVVGGSTLVRPSLGQRWHSDWSTLPVNLVRLVATSLLFLSAWALESPVVLAVACYIATVVVLLGISSVWTPAYRFVQGRVMAGEPNAMRVHVTLTMLPMGIALVGRLVFALLAAGS